MNQHDELEMRRKKAVQGCQQEGDNCPSDWEEHILRQQEEEADSPSDWVERQLDLQENPYPEPPAEVEGVPIWEIEMFDRLEKYHVEDNDDE